MSLSLAPAPSSLGLSSWPGGAEAALETASGRGGRFSPSR